MGLLGRIGHGITSAIDNAALNSLGGGLLGDVVNPNLQAAQGQPGQPQQVGSDEMTPQGGGGLLAAGQPQAPQRFTPTDAQKHALRSQFLMSLGSALSQGPTLGAGIANGVQNYQQNAIGEIQANKQQQMDAQRRAALGGFQQEMAQAAGDPAKQQQVLLKYGPVLGASEMKGYADVFKGMQPEKDDVVGAPFPVVGPDGKLAMAQHTKSGKVIPVPGYAPEEHYTTDGDGNIYNTRTAEIVHKKEAAPKEVRYQMVPTANGYIRVPETGSDGTPQPVLGPDGKPLMPFERPREPKDTSAADIAALDRETAHYAKPYEKNVADASAQLDKISEARAMINGGASAQALGIPKVLTALVSGAGSGVRITQAELNSIAHARGVQGDVQGWLSKVSGQGTLTAEQQRQLTAILNDAEGKITQKRQVSNDALDSINSARSRNEITQIDNGARKALYAPPAATSVSPKQAYVAGHVYGGLIYNGGDPQNQANWRKK